jgi:tetratricopeptide (TPR) repeat protein
MKNILLLTIVGLLTMCSCGTYIGARHRQEINNNNISQRKTEKINSKIIKNDDLNIEAYINRGIARMYQNKKIGALSDLNKAIKLSPKNSRAFSARGSLFHSNKNYKQAIEDYSSAIKINSKSEKDFYNRGWAYHMTNQNEKACSDWRSAEVLGSDWAGGDSPITAYCK